MEEYFIDRTTATLYVHPDVDTSNVIVSLSSSVVALKAGASNLALSNLRLGYAQGTVVDGSVEVTNVTVSNCDIFNAEGHGLVLKGSNVLVENSLVHNLGCGAVSLLGGDRASLEHGHIRAVGNTLTKYSLVTLL